MCRLGPSGHSRCKGEALAAQTLAQCVWMGNLLHKPHCPQYIKDVFHKSRVSLF
jgi:hypothetical protein